MVLSRCFEVFIREKILDGCQSSTITFYEYSVKKLISLLRIGRGIYLSMNSTDTSNLTFFL